jgi:hypothetical protein
MLRCGAIITACAAIRWRRRLLLLLAFWLLSRVIVPEKSVLGVENVKSRVCFYYL